MADRPALTARQVLILNTIRTAVAERGYPPTLRELTAAVGISSSSTASEQLRILEARGYIRLTPNTPRGIMILDPDEDPADQRAALTALMTEDLWAGPEGDLSYRTACQHVAAYLIEKGWHR